MKYTKHTFPWDHWTTTETLPEDIARCSFNACTSNRATPYSYGRRANFLYEKRKWIGSAVWQKRLNKEYLNPVLTPFLKTECKDYITLEETDNWRAEWISDPPGFHLDPHNDIPEKKMTMMVYLGRNENQGTSLYDGKGKIKNVPSGYNQGMIFFPAKNTSHGYPPARAVDNYRYALIINIVDKTFKEKPYWPITL